jgi:hypothetical protein
VGLWINPACQQQATITNSNVGGVKLRLLGNLVLEECPRSLTVSDGLRNMPSSIDPGNR